MAIEIIDLTGSSPPPAILDNNDITIVASNGNSGTGVEKKRRKRSKKTQEDRDLEGPWKHDKYSEGPHKQPDKTKRRNEDDDNYSKCSKKLARSPSPFFAIDTIPGEILADFIQASVANASHEDAVSVTEGTSVKDGILLPLHVTLAAEESPSKGDFTPPLSPVSETSGIDFVDDDRAVGTPRYFDDRTNNLKARGSCKKCGDSDHDFKNCKTVICLTCGVRNEHSSRSCPILRLCYACNGKGHIAKDCPRIGDMDHRDLDRNGCERCGSWKHHGTNCPTIWRIYTYMTDTERDAILADRESKRLLGFDNGGEGYIARDEWCYNCGNSGHLGDDCNMANVNYDRPNDYSAFGVYNKSTGPFASSSTIPHVARAPREWEQHDIFDDRYGLSAQTNVGRKGRENAKARAREAQRLLDEANDEPDWFNKNQTTSKGNGGGSPSLESKERSNLPQRPMFPTIQLGLRKSNSSRTAWVPSHSDAPPSRPSLRDRIDIGEGPGRTKSRRDDRRQREARRNNGESQAKDSGGYGMHKGHQRERGSRWHGGYNP